MQTFTSGWRVRCTRSVSWYCWEYRFLHSLLGVQVVIEDYVHDHALKVLSLVASTFAHVLIGAAGILSVLLIALGDGA